MLASPLLSLMAYPKMAHALSADLEALKAGCNLSALTSTKIPFICFDLAGGANFAGSNVLVGGPSGQLDIDNLSWANGYSRLGVPADMMPNAGVPPVVTLSRNLACTFMQIARFCGVSGKD